MRIDESSEKTLQKKGWIMKIKCVTEQELFEKNVDEGLMRKSYNDFVIEGLLHAEFLTNFEKTVIVCPSNFEKPRSAKRITHESVF